MRRKVGDRMRKAVRLLALWLGLAWTLPLWGCTAAAPQQLAEEIKEMEYCLDPAAPVIVFTPMTEDGTGLPCYYLFDDNPEHLNAKFLADGETPSGIAHFGSLTPGVYTVFSYHHRGYSVDFQADLYYDAVFSSEDSGVFVIEKLGLNQNWDWNQAWADYSRVPVSMPEYLRTFNCTCGGSYWHQPDCHAVIRDQFRTPNTDRYTSLGVSRRVTAGAPLYLSDMEGYITDNGLNHFRYGGWNEPMWMMMQFRVTEGTVNFDTLAYTDKDAAKVNFATLKDGVFDNESQYKGIAENAPVVTAAFSYEITEATPSGPVPVTVKNARVPEGITVKDGIFATNVNTWREIHPIAAESDLMQLKYVDDSKMALYGSQVPEGWRNNVWQFDALHTKHYGGYDAAWQEALTGYGVPVGERFQPNIDMKDVKHPAGTALCDDDFYKYNACNLGNFGVTERYEITLTNTDRKPRIFRFSMRSIAGQVYRYSLTDMTTGRVVQDDGGRSIMKMFDDDPPEDPNSTADPKERLKPNEYGDTLSFPLEPGKIYRAVIEITTLTGCVAPMHNQMTVD